MGLTGDPRPTFRYSRIEYGTTTVDFSDPCRAFSVPQGFAAGVNVALSGVRETLYYRREDMIRVSWPYLEPDVAYAIKRFIDAHAGQGEQFEFWLDRFTGAVWLFESTLLDQNELALTLSSGSASYATTASGKGIDLLAGTQYLSVALAQASAGTPTGFDDPLDKAEGVLVSDLKPNWAADDGVLHNLVDMSGATNRLRLYKTVANALTFEIIDNAGGSKTVAGAPTWAANDRVIAVARWSTGGVLALWYSTDGGSSFTALTTAGGAGTGLLSSLATTLYVGADQAGAGPCNAVVDSLAIFKRAFTNATALATYHPPFRNYWQLGELTVFDYEPARVAPGREIYTWGATIRKGA